MQTFAIVVANANPDIWSAIRKNWKSHHFLDERVALVSDEGQLTSEVAEKAGLSSGCPGIVIQVDYYSRWAASSLVERLDKNS